MLRAGCLPIQNFCCSGKEGEGLFGKARVGVGKGRGRNLGQERRKRDGDEIVDNAKVVCTQEQKSFGKCRFLLLCGTL